MPNGLAESNDAGLGGRHAAAASGHMHPTACLVTAVPRRCLAVGKWVSWGGPTTRSGAFEVPGCGTVAEPLTAVRMAALSPSPREKVHCREDAFGTGAPSMPISRVLSAELCAAAAKMAFCKAAALFLLVALVTAAPARARSLAQVRSALPAANSSRRLLGSARYHARPPPPPPPPPGWW